ncbi:carboxypeptidase-like regulatory domain-containing protein [Spirosoma arboris]|nr:carboxypeptidase-like regulatory domain-containing protein [Spirosoma arboris]
MHWRQSFLKTRFAKLGLLVWFSASVALAQTPLASLTGRVLDAKTGEPLPFATVYLNNSSQGTNADQNGVYKLASVPLGNHELVGSVLGYQTTRLPLRLTDTRQRTLDIKLEPADQSLASVTVTARHNQSWARQLRTFSRELLGNQPQARQCQITNPNVLSFQEEKGHLRVQASEPLIIENRALGYRLYYDLLYFDLYQGKMQFAGASRFEEIKAPDTRQQARWQANRMNVYRGSLQHLLASLLTGTHEQAGYLVYRTPLTNEGVNRALPFVKTRDRQYISREQTATLFKPGELPFERRLVSDQPLEVYYNRVYAANSPYRDSPYAYSMLILPKGSLELTTNGWITQGNGLDVRGYMGNDRLATLLPADWAPTDGEMLISESVAAGRPGRADARLDTLVANRRRQYERTPPVVYVQTDKAFYCTGDQLWLSAYVIDPARQLPIAGRTGTPLHLELVTSGGQRVQHQWLRLIDGRAAASFRLADTLSSDTYFLRAYTDLDQPANGPAFECSFPVYNLSQLNTKQSVGKSDLAKVVFKSAGKPLSDSLDVQFLPEGGRWLAGVVGRLGIKALRPNGKGSLVSGRIVDQTGLEVARFSTNSLGMGQVSLSPQSGQHYRALIDLNGATQTVPLPDVESEGWALAADAVSDSSRVIISIRATGRYSQQPVYLTLQSREQLAYRQKWLLTKGEAKFTLSTAALPPGVCRLTVWDTTNQPRAERLIFIPERSERIQMRVTTAKPQYEPRQEVVIGLQFRDSEGYPVAGSWSAAVTDADQLPADTNRVDLRTYMLLTSGLRGTIESPAYYIEPEHLGDLDNLLLTQGWRRLPSASVVDSTGGWTLSGHVRDKQGNLLTQKTMLLWLGKGDQQQIRSVTTDNQGQFQVSSLLLTDSVPVQARVFSTGLAGAAITFDTPGGHFNTPVLTDSYSSLPTNLLTQASSRQAAWPALYRDSTARQLAEVTVRAMKPPPERPIDVERSSLHAGYDAVIRVDENSPSFANVFELMMGRLPGASIIPNPMGGGYSVTIRGPSSFGNSGPLYLLDGVYADQTVLLQVDPRTVSRVELLKNPTTAGIYGARAAGGVIAVYTKKGNNDQLAKPSSTAVTVFGFVTPREFYVPRYESSPVDTHQDRRDMLFWQPLGQTDTDGLGRLIFPLSDTAKRLRIVLQGLTNEGVPMAFTWELPVR